MLLLPSFTGQPERNRVYHTGALSLLKALGDESVDLFVTSPPYNLRNSTGGGLKWNGETDCVPRMGLQDGYESYSDDMPYSDYVNWQRSILNEMMRTLKPNGAIFYNHKWRVQGGLIQDRQEIINGYPVRQVIIWARNGGQNFNQNYFLPTYEVIYLICKPDFRLNEYYKIGDVWFVQQEKNSLHPAPFPFEIPRRCIQATDAQLIVDPFMGSGTTAIAAQQLGRDYIGCDISLNYVEMARRRLAGKPLEPELAKQSTIFEALEAV